MALKNVMRGAARAVLLPLMMVACSTGMMGMAPADGSDASPQTQTLKNREAQTNRVDESYNLTRLVIRWDAQTGNFDMQLQGFDQGQNTGTGKPTKMSLAFSAIRGKGENRTGNSTVVIVDEIKFQYDPSNNDGSMNTADIDVTLEPNHYGSNKSIFTVVPTNDPNNTDEMAEAFEVRSQRYTAKGLPIIFTDMQGRRLPNVKQAVNDIVGTTALGMAVQFKQMARSVALGNGQERDNYFPEQIYKTGAQYGNN